MRLLSARRLLAEKASRRAGHQGHVSSNHPVRRDVEVQNVHLSLKGVAVAVSVFVYALDGKRR